MVTIFLDIDGVLATLNEFMRNSKNFQEKHEWAKKINVPYPFDPKCVKIFNEILSTTECQIVLSSDWRISWTLEELGIIFKENGVNQVPVDITEKKLFYNTSLYDKVRGAEIEFYIQENQVKDWIILDDLTIYPYVQKELRDRVFETNDLEGLKQTGMKKKIIKKLKEYDTEK